MAENSVVPLPSTDPPMPRVSPLQSTPWQGTQSQPPVVSNQNVWQQPSGQLVNPLAGLLDQSTQFQGVKKLTETQDEEPYIGGIGLGGGYAGDAPVYSEFVTPLPYSQYQPTRRYEVL